MEKMKGYGLDPQAFNVQRLSELFPEAVTDGKIDFDMLRTLLGDYVDSSNERYCFSWIGKASAIRNALSPSNGTLLAEPSKSIDFYSTNNIYVEGDNLEVLKLLSKTYHHKVKLIYIDPPYNTGHDFVYNDTFADGVQDYVELSNQTAKTNPETNGRFHTDWLNMMYPRLKLAKELLIDDGAIFISIGEQEVANLAKICDEIFGETNRIAIIPNKARASVSNDKIISPNANFILFYAKDFDSLFLKRKSIGLDPILEGFDDDDGDGNGPYRLVPVDGPGGAKKGNPYFEFLGVEGYFRFSKETMEKMYQDGLLVKKGNSLYQKYYLSKAKDSRRTATTWWDDVGLTSSATASLKNLMGGSYFDNPKPIELVDRLLRMLTHDDPDCIVMDFFSGSATTAHSLMQFNTENGGHRRFILVQLPERVDEGTEAFEAGFRTICDIGEERIRLAGAKIKAQLELERQKAGLLADQLPNPDDLDFGFKVFRLDSSNIIAWDGYKQYTEEEVMLFGKVIKDDRTDLDVAYEIMLKYGVFDKQLIEKQVNGKKMFSVDNDSMIICLADEITADDVMAIVKLKPSVVVFKEAGFKDDNEKMNADYTLKHYLGEGDIKVLCI